MNTTISRELGIISALNNKNNSRYSYYIPSTLRTEVDYTYSDICKGFCFFIGLPLIFLGSIVATVYGFLTNNYTYFKVGGAVFITFLILAIAFTFAQLLYHCRYKDEADVQTNQYTALKTSKV